MKQSTQIIIGTIVLLILFIGYFCFGSNMAIPAQTADNILRPLVGGKNTITIESWYFALGDKIKQIEYTFVKPNTHIFASIIYKNAAKTAQSKSDSSMDLVNISPNKNFPPIAAEGIWQTIPEPLFPKKLVMAKTFMRPDPTRSYAIVSLVKMNMQSLSLGVEAGTYYPGGTHHIYGPGVVPKKIQQSNNLVAVFNGGFMERDGHYGMIVGNKTYVPLRKNLATLVISSSGSANIISYQNSSSLDKNVIGVRQNGAFLVRNGKLAPFVENGIDTWGRTTTNSTYTWRSGIGITKKGNLVYAVGNSLIPQTLAKALLAAGAQNAMQLDINPFWVRFILYYPQGNGNYSYYPLLQDMQNGGFSYLHRYNKDFFYVYKKS